MTTSQEDTRDSEPPVEYIYSFDDDKSLDVVVNKRKLETDGDEFFYRVFERIKIQSPEIAISVLNDIKKGDMDKLAKFDEKLDAIAR